MMKLRYLHTFIAVAEELHFGKAAKRLRIAQPAISQTIAALEQELGTQLFFRTKRSVSLTEAGKVFLAGSYSILEKLEHTIGLASQASSGEIGSLRISFTSVCTLSLFPQAVIAFSKRYPKVKLVLEQMGTAEQLVAVAAGKVDVGFSILVEKVGDLRLQRLTSEPLYAYLHRDHPLAGCASVSVGEIFSDPFILMSKKAEPEMHSAFYAICEEHHCHPNIVLETDHVEVMLAFVRAGYGVSLAPRSVAQLAPSDVVGLPVQPFIESGVSVMWDPLRPCPTREHFLRILGDMS
ncbi:MAG: LysR family transcriptional regulator [Myxococcales bacterium]|nr:LysR family transcriptional regulator [Myxococcales bacterium]MCB9641511.1 LysR family transcriptional regulator [Myxococcales bacterium]